MTYHVSLNNFTTRNQLNQIIAENMVDVKLFQEGHDDFEEIAVFCFTKAYEICDKICKSLPNIWKIPDYYKLARYPSTDIDFVTKIQAVTMSIVCIFTDHFPKGWRDSNKLFLEKLKDSIYHMYVKGENEELMEVTQAIYPSVCVKTFKALRRRTNIDLELSFGDFFLPEYINASVEDAIQKRIDKIPVPKYTVSGSVLSIDTISFKEYETKTKRKAEGEPINIAELQERVAYLNKENSELKAQRTQKDITIKELESQIESLKSTPAVVANMDVDYDNINKWAKVIFFATVLNAAYQKKFTVGQQLALFICLICGGKPSTYQPIISKIATMEDNEKDKSGETYSPQVIKAAKEIVNRLVEIPEGEDVHPTIQGYIDSICDEFSIERPKKKKH